MFDALCIPRSLSFKSDFGYCCVFVELAAAGSERNSGEDLQDNIGKRSFSMVSQQLWLISIAFATLHRRAEGNV